MATGWVAHTKRHNVEPCEEYIYTLQGSTIHMPWSRLFVGASVVIPTVASAFEVARAFDPAASFFEYKLRCEEIIWHDMLAVRVHRIS